MKHNILALILMGALMVSCARKTNSDMEYYLKFKENRFSARLETPVVLKDADGNIVASLSAGCLVQSPSLDDVSDVDISDNQRMKIVFDIPVNARWQKVEGNGILTGVVEKDSQ